MVTRRTNRTKRSYFHAGDLRQTITLSRYKRKPDTTGNGTDSIFDVTEYASIRAKVLFPREVPRHGDYANRDLESFFTFCFRKRRDVSASDMIIWNSRWFKIQDVLQDQYEDFTKARCVEVAPNEKRDYTALDSQGEIVGTGDQSSKNPFLQWDS